MYGIKDLRTGQYVQQEDGLIVNCSSYKAFWIKWDDGLLRVGEGMTIFFMRCGDLHYMYVYRTPTRMRCIFVIVFIYQHAEKSRKLHSNNNMCNIKIICVCSDEYYKYHL